MSGLDDSGEAVKMASTIGVEVPQVHTVPRPRLIPQQSNSVPSTPRQHPRDFAFNVRTPSPAAQDGSRSPQSAVSEAVRPLPTSRAVVSNNCRFMSTQTSRRRMPYTIGTDRLERDVNVKVVLDVEEEKRLSESMSMLFKQLLPTPETQANRGRVVSKLQTILTNAWPEKSIQVAIFGSSGNLLCTTESDGRLQAPS